MRSRANYLVIASVLAAALCAAGCSKAGVEAQPKILNSAVAFDVYEVVGEKDQLLGTTPSKQPLVIPPCRWWYVEPLGSVDMEEVFLELEAKRIPGLRLRNAMDQDLEQLGRMTGLQYLDLWGGMVTDEGLEDLKGLLTLQSLCLSYTDVTDAGLAHLKGLTGLEYLDLQGTKKITDAGLEHLRGLTALQQLDLRLTHVTDAGLEHLNGLTGLRILDLSYTKVTAAGVRQLKMSLPNVEVDR